MAKGFEVLQMLVPNGGWRIVGDDFEGIEFVEAAPITKAEFEAGFALVDSYNAEQEAKKEIEKKAILAKLGLTADELQTALS